MAFLETLTNSSDDGRILLKRGQPFGTGTLKFLLLNPAAHFQDIVQQARYERHGQLFYIYLGFNSVTFCLIILINLDQL